jgi:hypothetical protein
MLRSRIIPTQKQNEEKKWESDDLRAKKPMKMAKKESKKGNISSAASGSSLM